MSIRVYARRVRDRDLPFGRRYRALRDAVGCYCPLGFHGTWSYLRTAGDLRNDETALLHALEKLEASRTVWLREVESFADRRRTDKARHQRAPRQAEVRYLLGWRWPGPDGKQAMLGEVGRLWVAHCRSPFPDVPAGSKADLTELDTWLADCVSTYLAHDGDLDIGRQDVIMKCLPKLRRHVSQLGYPWTFPPGVCILPPPAEDDRADPHDKARGTGG
ncbi:hypothetical protein AB0420_11135 [Streptomyces caelestis]|uniref:hypothetical protein n=1 Tax=Streptomyces TaxID=1883 RepID=UPI0004CC09FA|nr:MULTISPECIES: hypothetical protein [Streptomyces]